jgi:hypothetical protein
MKPLADTRFAHRLLGRRYCQVYFPHIGPCMVLPVCPISFTFAAMYPVLVPWSCPTCGSAAEQIETASASSASFRGVQKNRCS